MQQEWLPISSRFCTWAARHFINHYQLSRHLFGDFAEAYVAFRSHRHMIHCCLVSLQLLAYLQVGRMFDKGVNLSAKHETGLPSSIE